MSAPRVAFSDKEMRAVETMLVPGTISDGKSLQSLYNKMVKAKEAKPVYDFTDKMARDLAYKILGNDVYFAQSVHGIVMKHNKYLKANNLGPDEFEKACKVAARTWKKPIFYDVLLMSSRKLAAQPLFEEPTVNVFGE